MSETVAEKLDWNEMGNKKMLSENADEDDDGGEGGSGATGLESIEMGAGRVQVDDKKIINCRADLNQLVPFKYKWAWQKYIEIVLTCLSSCYVCPLIKFG